MALRVGPGGPDAAKGRAQVDDFTLSAYASLFRQEAVQEKNTIKAKKEKIVNQNCQLITEQ